VLHLGWVRDGAGHHGQMAVLVKPNGLVGSAYMAAITPFRHLIVYPRMMEQIGASGGRGRLRRRQWWACITACPRPRAISQRLTG
jgi:hypothetical protein